MTAHRSQARLPGALRPGRVLIASLALAAGYADGARAADTRMQDEVAVRKVFTDFAAAFSGHDARAAAGLCAQDVNYIVGDGSDIRGRTAVENHLAPLFTGRLRGMQRNTSLQEVRFVRPDVAVLIGSYETVGAIGPSGTLNPPTQGVYDWVVSKQGGRWLISLWHEATLPGQTATAVVTTAGPAQSAPSSPPDEARLVASANEEPPLFFHEGWTIPLVTHEGIFGPKHVANPNLELSLYGSPEAIDPARKPQDGMQVESGPGNPGHIFTGLCAKPCAMALHDKSHYVDLGGLGKLRWLVKTSGLHLVHPIVKLSDGRWLLGEHGDGSFADYHPYEFTLSDTRWIELDITRVVTRGRWLDSVDLSRVDEVGFADVIPGSGHHAGGFAAVGWIEVYGKAVPRAP